jgi:hypothetical protein
MDKRPPGYATLALATLLSTASSARAQAVPDTDYLSGPWHFRAVTCLDTRVTAVEPRLVETGEHPPYRPESFKRSGVVVTFASGLGVRPLFPKAFAAVLHYDGDTANDVMVAEKPGDRVQLCFLGGPAPTVGANGAIGCNPDTDPRGRQYRVWDYAQRKQYVGYNAEHLCGGA